MCNEEKERCGVKIRNFERNNYYHGKLMTIRDFFAEQCYFNERRWLLNRMISGWGVVCGLDVEKVDNTKVRIKPGLAIDCCGREILVCDPREVELIPTEDECRGNTGQTTEPELYIGLEFWECKTEEVQIAPAACDQGEKCEFNRLRDSFKVRIFRPEEVIVNPPGLCPLTEGKPVDLQHYLCEKMKAHYPKCPELPRNHAVILAKVTQIENGNVTDIDIEACPIVRRQVYNNKTLFDLINCYHGELPHIIEINWGHDEEMDWDDFANKIGGPDQSGTGLWVTFDRDVEGVNDNTFLLLVDEIGRRAGYTHKIYIPGNVSYDSETKTAIFKVTSDWYDDEIVSAHSLLLEGASFQVILRGDHIYVLEGTEGTVRRALDANFIGGKLPSGNGTQGGDFVSWFKVGAKKPTSSARK